MPPQSLSSDVQFTVWKSSEPHPPGGVAQADLLGSHQLLQSVWSGGNRAEQGKVGCVVSPHVHSLSLVLSDVCLTVVLNVL